MRHRPMIWLSAFVGAGGGWLLAYTATICSVYADAPSGLSRCEVTLLGLTVPRVAGTITLGALGFVVGLAIGWGVVRALTAGRT